MEREKREAGRMFVARLKKNKILLWNIEGK
jgi:hypothetical protein